MPELLIHPFPASLNAKLHAGSVDFHMGGDLRNSITAANASDQATSNTLLNELKKKFNRSAAAKPDAVVLLKTGGTQTQPTITTAVSETALLSAAVTGVLLMTRG